MRWRSKAALVACVAASLAAPSSAYGAYWFFQGNMASPSTVHAGIVVGWYYNYTRMSWTNPSHDMKFSLVDKNGNWHGIDAWAAAGYDQDVQFVTTVYTQGGCNNPLGFWTVWVNCHVGNDP